MTTLIPTASLAKLFNLTERRIQQLAKDGIIPKADRGQYHLLSAVKNYVAFLQKAASRAGGDSEDIARSRARFELARAEEKELDVARMLGEIVLADDVEQFWNQAASNWKAKLLALPDNIALRCASMTDRYEIEEIVRQIIEASLTEIALYESSDTKPDTKPTKTKATPKKRTKPAQTATKTDC